MLYQILNFWNYKTVFAHVSSAAPGYAYTEHLPTLGFTEIINQVTCWALPWDSQSLVSVTPQISNDAQNWESLTAHTVGPLTSPATTIFKQTEVAAYQRFQIEISTAMPLPFTADSGLSLLIQSLGRGGKESKAPRFSTPDSFIKYLDAVRRGENWGNPPKGGRFLEFFPRQIVVTSDDGTAQWRTVYTRPIATHECDKVLAALSVDSFIDSSGGGIAQMVVYPQISIDGIHWYELWTDGFTAITLGTTFPFLEHKLIQAVGAFMRFGINFLDPGGMMASMGAAIEIIGCSIDR